MRNSLLTQSADRGWMLTWQWPLFWVGLLITEQVVASLWLSPGYPLTLNTDLSQFTLLLATMVVFLRNGRLCSWPGKLFWYLIASGSGVRLIAQLAWMYYELVLRHEVPNPFVGDVLLFMSGVPVLAAFLLQTQTATIDELRGTRLYDFSLLLLWWLYLYLYFVIPWQYVNFDEVLYGQAYNRLNGLQDCVLLLVLFHLTRRSEVQHRTFFALFMAAHLVATIVGYVVNVAIDQHRYYTGSGYDIGWTAALALFPMIGVRARLLRRSIGTVGLSSTQLPLDRIGVIVQLSLPLITAYSVLTCPTLRGVTQFRQLVVLGAITIMAAIMFARHSCITAQLASAARVLHEASVTDALTGARNRRFFEATIPAAACQCVREHLERRGHKGTDLVFYLIDLDDFKQVNDHYGHMAGDRVLEEAARIIRSVIRASDLLIRWGGDEFLLLTRHCERNEAGVLAERILCTVAQIARHGGSGKGDRQTCSIGWAAFPWNPEEPADVGWEAVLGLADEALYCAKAAGRNQAVGFLASKAGGDLVTVTGAGDVDTYAVQKVTVRGSVLKSPRLHVPQAPVLGDAVPLLL